MYINQIRKSFLDFFSYYNHKIIKSSPLVPTNDHSLLFTNSGMVQFKNQFIGNEITPYSRVATSQKCIRVGGKHNDLENIGYTARHHTFFEMLGNFSFGDYFKEKAIYYAWEYLTKILKVNKNRLYVTVYHTDEEAYKLWKKISNFSESKIIRIKTNDNFWSMGDLGPCGPCSEIFYDHGEKYFGDLPGKKNQDGDRFVEVWNLVFMQYEKLKNGKQINLPKPSIDTGMGLERILAVIQGVNSAYDTNIFKTLIDGIKQITSSDGQPIANKIIADHIRSASILISDGVLPSNEGRGYVLRRILRRAMRHVHNIGYDNNLLTQLSHVLISETDEIYPELQEARELITSTINAEEERFRETLKRGMRYLNEQVRSLSKNGIMSGETAFKLYDTYGFPLDLTVSILKEKNLILDQKGFKSAMEEQKRMSRSSWSKSKESTISPVWTNIYNTFGETKFISEEICSYTTEVIAIIKNNINITNAQALEKVILVFKSTTFYAESGGQIGDKGWINKSYVYDTKTFDRIYGHFVELKEPIRVGQTVELKVDYNFRNLVKANHSATHLLHFVLKQKLGNHVVQKGSLINECGFRFDFTNSKALTVEEINSIEILVNQIIISNVSVLTNLMKLCDAKNSGAVALFGERYDEEVKVVKIGNSIELCGGTHVKYSGDIGAFAIVNEESVAVGVRRIQAMTGVKAIEFFRRNSNKCGEISAILKSSDKDLVKNILGLGEKIKELQRQREQYKNEVLLNKLERVQSRDIVILMLNLQGENEVNLKSLYRILKNNKKSIVLLINQENFRTSILIGVTQDLSNKYDAKELVNSCLHIIDGMGGGNNAFAQASGKKINVQDKIIERIKSIV